MSYGKIKNGVVVQKQPHPKNDFIEIPDHVVPGYLYQNGEFIAPEPDSRPDELESPSDILTYMINRKDTNVSSGQFYDVVSLHNWSAPSGSWSGYTNNIFPFMVPYNCKLTLAHINFRGINYNWRSDPGSVYLDMGFLDHGYNGAFNERGLRLEIEDSFEGNSVDWQSFRFTVGEDNITAFLGENYFTAGEIIGVLLRTGPSVPGRINSISYPHHLLCFTGV